MRFLSEEYLAEATRRLRESEPVRRAVAGDGVVVQYTVTATPSGEELAYHLRVHDGVPELVPGQAERPDIVIGHPYRVAAAIDRGELHVQRAVVQGLTRVTGNLAMFLAMEGLLAAAASACGSFERQY